jgi:hypothetical protein
LGKAGIVDADFVRLIQQLDHVSAHGIDQAWPHAAVRNDADAGFLSVLHEVKLLPDDLRIAAHIGEMYPGGDSGTRDLQVEVVGHGAEGYLALLEQSVQAG